MGRKESNQTNNWKHINFIYNHLFRCNHTCNCVDMGYVTSASLACIFVLGFQFSSVVFSQHQSEICDMYLWYFLVIVACLLIQPIQTVGWLNTD